ncbi:spore germination protein GerPE [Peribacillus sp. SCS-155]|uniref:spore germination protein GerPE n=1 Tax=Peribacillus sedimenti TaxID=3115297 RepID=UPI00390642D7
MFSRISRVNRISLKTLVFSSVFQIGDVNMIDGNSNNFALQREEADYSGQEGKNLTDPIFTFTPPQLLIYEPLWMTVNNPHPFISVESLNIIGASASSVIGIGNVRNVRMRSAIKHIRQHTGVTGSLDEE